MLQLGVEPITLSFATTIAREDMASVLYDFLFSIACITHQLTHTFHRDRSAKAEAWPLFIMSCEPKSSLSYVVERRAYFSIQHRGHCHGISLSLFPSNFLSKRQNQVDELYGARFKSWTGGAGIAQKYVAWICADNLSNTR